MQTISKSTHEFSESWLRRDDASRAALRPRSVQWPTIPVRWARTSAAGRSPTAGPDCVQSRYDPRLVTATVSRTRGTNVERSRAVSSPDCAALRGDRRAQAAAPRARSRAPGRGSSPPSRAAVRYPSEFAIPTRRRDESRARLDHPLAGPPRAPVRLGRLVAELDLVQQFQLPGTQLREDSRVAAVNVRRRAPERPSARARNKSSTSTRPAPITPSAVISPVLLGANTHTGTARSPRSIPLTKRVAPAVAGLPWAACGRGSTTPPSRATSSGRAAFSSHPGHESDQEELIRPRTNSLESCRRSASRPATGRCICVGRGSRWRPVRAVATHDNCDGHAGHARCARRATTAEIRTAFAASRARRSIGPRLVSGSLSVPARLIVGVGQFAHRVGQSRRCGL